MDIRILPLLEQKMAEDDPRDTNRRDVLRQAWQPMVEHVEALRRAPVIAFVPAALDAIAMRLRLRAHHTEDPAVLVAQVYADPSDDSARAVLGDLLQQRGDPRGEHIALQLARNGRTAREIELAKTWGRTWIGPLGEHLEEGSLVFEREFLARARRLCPELSPELIAADEWSTVTHLDNPSVHDVDLLLSPSMRSLRHVSQLSQPVLRGLLRSGAAVPWLSVGLAGAPPQDDLEATVTLFASVEKLVFERYGSNTLKLKASELLAALRGWPSLEEVEGPFAIGQLVPLLADHRSEKLRRLTVLLPTSTFSFDRAARRLEVTATLLPREGAEIAEVVAGLAASGLIDTADMRFGAKAIVPVATLRAAAAASGVAITITIHGDPLRA